jgi:hypothetical protein
MKRETIKKEIKQTSQTILFLLDLIVYVMTEIWKKTFYVLMEKDFLEIYRIGFFTQH